jgi:hypothetical protein
MVAWQWCPLKAFLRSPNKWKSIWARCQGCMMDLRYKSMVAIVFEHCGQQYGNWHCHATTFLTAALCIYSNCQLQPVTASHCHATTFLTAALCIYSNCQLQLVTASHCLSQPPFPQNASRTGPCESQNSVDIPAPTTGWVLNFQSISWDCSLACSGGPMFHHK